MKNKILFLVVAFGILAFFQPQSASATVCKTASDCSVEILNKVCTNGTCTTTAGVDANSACAKAHPGFACMEKANGSECVSKLCLGATNIQCCKLVTPIALTTNPTSAVNNSVGTSTGGSTEFVNPLGSITTVEALLGNIMGAVQKIIVTLALVAIVVGALMYVTSFGVEKQTTQAKEAISAALIGMAIAVAAPSLLKELAGVLGWTTNNSNVNGALSLSAIALKVLSFLLGTFGVVSLIMMIIGASLYMTSAGDEDRATKGKDVFKYAVLGVVIAMSAMILVRQIAKFFVA